ncbi:MAG: type II toxin-antitoxin system RelE/ParE family toxin [Chlorobiaceae bacterium]|nr:type II toxin-antitoxin system RelE/ParE family toxin [Chlorobiaceae bacterium]
MNVMWSPSALDDVESIAEYIARDSVEIASIFVGKIFDVTDRLQKFPLSGRVIPEIRESVCREIIFGAYRIMNRIVQEEVWITGVMHGARDWKIE